MATFNTAAAFVISMDSSQYAANSSGYDEKEATRKLENLPPIIPRNENVRKDARDKGLITGFMQNRKWGSLLKITPKTNKKIKTKLKATLAATPTKQARPATHNKYHNWNLDPFQFCFHNTDQSGFEGI